MPLIAFVAIYSNQTWVIKGAGIVLLVKGLQIGKKKRET